MGKIVKNSLGFDTNLKIYQDKSMFNYSIDTILLGNFITINSKIKNILEIGTNNGALAIFVAHRSTKIHIDALEIQEQAIKIAKRNLILNHKDKQINLICQDFKLFYKQHNQNQAKKYDAIICNPPFYKMDNFKKHKNSQAKLIATHEVLLTLENVIQGSSKIIRQKGCLTLVIATERLIDVLVLMRRYNFEPKKIQFVHPRADQKSNLVLIEGRFQVGWGTLFLPNIYLHHFEKQNSSYSNQIKKLFKPIVVRGKYEK